MRSMNIRPILYSPLSDALLALKKGAQLSPYDDVRRRVTLLASCAASLVGLCYATFFSLAGLLALGLAQGLLSVLVLVVNLHPRISHKVAVEVMNAAVALSIFFCVLEVGGTDSPGLMWFALPSLQALALAGMRSAAIWTAINLALIGSVFCLEAFGFSFGIPARIHHPFKIFTVLGSTAYVTIFALAHQSISTVLADIALEQKEAAEHANKAKTIFLATMSHELRTPLNAVLGYTELIGEELEDHELTHLDSMKDLEAIRVAGKSLLASIGNVLDLARVESGQIDLHLEQLSLRDVLADVRISTASLPRPDISFREEVHAPDTLSLLADRTALTQVLFNLIDNAFKFTEEGEVRLVTSHTPTHLSFDVHDTGMGIPQEKLDMIFEPFSQANSDFTRQRDGAGLGLTLSKRLISLMHGTLTVTSTPQRGSHFCVTLPLHHGGGQTR